MALTLAQRDVLATNADFLSRVRGSLSKQGQYYLDLAGAATAEQRDWAANLFWAGRRLNQIAADLAPQLTAVGTIVNASQPDASDVTDDQFQGAVASICDSYS
jgi:hypothetical protein